MTWHQQLRRLRYQRRVSGSALHRCWQTPSPSGSMDWREVEFLACDAEMSGLDPEQSEILSLGWVSVEQGRILLATAQHHLLRPDRDVGSSATIHHLRDCEFDEAAPRDVALSRLLAAASGKVLVFHNAKLDMAFLDRLCTRCFQAPLLLPAIDTLQLEHRLLRRRDVPIRQGDLRLQACRDRYALPALPAHNALSDALATAELLIAHASQRAAGCSLKLTDLR